MHDLKSHDSQLPRGSSRPEPETQGAPSSQRGSALKWHFAMPWALGLGRLTVRLGSEHGTRRFVLVVHCLLGLRVGAW